MVVLALNGRLVLGPFLLLAICDAGHGLHAPLRHEALSLCERVDHGDLLTNLHTQVGKQLLALGPQLGQLGLSV